MDCLTKFSGTRTEDNKTELLRSLESTAGVYRFPHEGKSSPNPFHIRCERFTAQSEKKERRKKKKERRKKQTGKTAKMVNRKQKERQLYTPNIGRTGKMEISHTC